MAKRAKAEQFSISTREEAERALYDLGMLRDRIDLVENRENGIIREAQERMVKETERDRKHVAALEKDLEHWATCNQDLFPKDSRTLVLNYGRVWFRKSPPKLRLLLKVESVLARLRAIGLLDCIRTKEEVDREVLAAYDEETLKRVGVKRGQRDEFYYKCDRVEVQ